jgi:alpha-amylase/alpha-mannosidase (GH57 family)
MNRFICIHGHFYQPPRENPWLEDIELQDSAYPFHDWNERITAECYEPNRAARILDEQKRISRIVNNYADISFNFGPTLLSWLEQARPATYRAALEADRLSCERFSGHGSALAQCYSHLIMPLANQRDKRTQILWGIRDFVHRFGREPEGMWLPETAVDLESLDLLAEQGIAFTILAPHQAKRVRKIGEKSWQDVSGAKIDPKMPYRCSLPSGRSIALFFYDGPIARDVAFSGLLDDGQRFAKRLLGNFSDRDDPQLMHIATDGETYGHHHRFGEMALAYCLDYIESRQLAKITVYGEFLEQHPPTHEAEIAEETSWSCAHGVERWRADCGCHIGGEAGWDQAWRGPLREALDWLRDRLAPVFEQGLAGFFADPWGARDAYIGVILDRSRDQVQSFLQHQAGRKLTAAEAGRALSLLEMQRHAMLMYTSCGWFFDEVSGIETTQILGYAGRALQLAEKVTGIPIEKEFLGQLERAPSNLSRWGNAARVYQGHVIPSRLDLTRVAAHYAIVSGFDEPCAADRPHRHEIHCYTAEGCESETFAGGRMQLTVGRTRIRSRITWNQGNFAFAVLNLGGHNISAGVRPYQHRQALAAMRDAVTAAFEKSDIPEVVRQMDRYFGSHNYSLWHLFKDEQRRVVNRVMAQTLEEIETSFRTIYENHFPLMRFLREIRMPIPRPLSLPVELVLISQFGNLLENSQTHPNQLKALAEVVNKLDIPLDDPMLGIAAGRQVERQMEKLALAPRNLALILTLIETLEVLQDLPIRLDLWQAQNLYWDIHSTLEPGLEGLGGEELLFNFRRLGDCLQMRIA